MNVKPGDLAMVVDAPRMESHGRTCEILEAWGEFEPFGQVWTVRWSRPQRSRFGGMTDVTQAPDIWLRRISGPCMEDETPLETNMPEAFSLAFGIHAPVLS